MSDIIDLNEERNRRTGPDPEFRRKDDFGREMFCYLLSYEMGGSHWGTQVWAYSIEDADARVAAMRESLVVDGQLFSEIPA